MGLLSSRSYIQLHALFQLVLAVYLTNSREVITDTELVYSDQNGRLRIDNLLPTFTRRRSPFAYCGILLLLFAIFDLTLALKLPTLNHLLAVARYIRNTAANTPAAWSPTVRKITDEFSDMYRHLCILLMTLRLAVFLIVTVKIGLSPAELWTGAFGLAGLAPSSLASGAGVGAAAETDIMVDDSSILGLSTSMAADQLVSSVDELKCRVVLLYGVMEALFSTWVVTALYDEQIETEKSFRSIGTRARTALTTQRRR
ncbi:hypothetical protein VTO42DRAFT_3915 [Malbranchea cinnamomea]